MVKGACLFSVVWYHPIKYQVVSNVIRTQLKPQLYWLFASSQEEAQRGAMVSNFPIPVELKRMKKERKGYLTVIVYETRSQIFINVNNSFTQHLWSSYWYFDSVVKFLLLVSSLCVYVCAHMCMTVCRYMYLCGINTNE